MERRLGRGHISIERGVPSRRTGPWHVLLWILGQVVAFVLGIVIGPLVLVIDIGRVGQRVGKGWIAGFLVTALLLTAVTWQVKELLAGERERVVDIITDYSEIRGTLTDVPYFDLIALYAVKRNLDPALVAAVIKQESRFDPLAVSPMGARGLMQIQPVTWRYMYPESTCSGRHGPDPCGDDCIFEPEANIAVGTAYFRMLVDEFEGDLVLAFAAYNAGPTAVRRYSGGLLGHGLPPYLETRGFVRQVLANWLNLREDPAPVELDPARLKMLAELDASLFRLTLGYWLVLFVWLVFKIPWLGRE